MAAEGTPTGKTLTDVVDQLEDLNKELDQQGENSRRSGAQLVKGGKLGRVFAFFHRRGAKKRDVARGKEITALRGATMSEFAETETRHNDTQQQAGQQTTQLENLSEVQGQLLEGDEFATGEMQRQTDHMETIADAAKDQVGNQLHHIDLVESGNESLTGLSESLPTDIAAATAAATEDDSGGNNWALESGGFLSNISASTESIGSVMQTQGGQMDKTVDILANILNLQLDDSAAAREAAAEAARKGGAGEDQMKVPDAKAEEAKAGGFFSKMGKAVMNPVGAMGRGMKSMGKGISGFLKGLASGLAAFANPLVVIGVAAIAISLPIFAAGLAAAFKVFEMIAGEGKALEFVTGIIESLGNAIGTILKNVLEGFGNMVKNMGPFITAFFDGLATVVKALTPIVTSLFKVIKDIITDPVLNKTMQAVIKAISSAITDVRKVLVAFAPVVESILNKVGDVIIAVADKIEKIVATVGKVIEKILGSFDNVVNQIEPIVKAIGASISGIIDSISAGITKLGTAIEGIINAIGDNVAKIGTSIEGIITSIGAAVTKVINSISGLIKTIGDTIVTVIDGIVTGIERLSGLDAGNMFKVALGLTALAAALVLFSVGAAIGGAVMPKGEVIEGMAKNIERFAAIAPGSLFELGKGIMAVGGGLAVFGVGAAIGGNFMPDGKVIEGLANSVERFGKIPSENLAKVGTGMSLIGKGLADFGAGGALASLMAPGEAQLDKIAKSVELFGKVPSENLAPVGTGMSLIGVGLKDFAIGGAIANLLNDPKGLIGVSESVARFGQIDASNFAMVGTGIKAIGDGLMEFGKGGFVSGLAEGFGKWIGASDPVDKFAKFALIGPQLFQAGQGVTALASSFKSFDADNLEKLGDGLDKFMGKVDMEKLTAFSKATEGLMTGQMLAQLQVESKEAGGGTNTTIINNTSTNQVNSSAPLVMPASGVSPSNGDVMNVRIIS